MVQKQKKGRKRKRERGEAGKHHSRGGLGNLQEVDGATAHGCPAGIHSPAGGCAIFTTVHVLLHPSTTLNIPFPTLSDHKRG